MGDTPAFFVLTLVATLLISAGILWNQSIRNSHTIARSFYCLCVLLSSATLLLSFVRQFGLLNGSLFNRIFHILIFRGWIVIGTALSITLLIALNAPAVPWSRASRPAIRSLINSRYLLKGICLSVAFAFICTEIGKLGHDAEMRRFFVQSGYPVWFLYFVILGEVLGSIGLMIPRTLFPATIGLSILMLGAIGTHVHNGDPFSDPLEALHLLILLGSIVLIHLHRGKARFTRAVRRQLPPQSNSCRLRNATESHNSPSHPVRVSQSSLLFGLKYVKPSPRVSGMSRYSVAEWSVTNDAEPWRPRRLQELS